MTQRQPRNTISEFLRRGRFRRRQFMEFARHAVQFDAKLAPILEDWDHMTAALQNATHLDALCEAHDVDPAHFIAAVGEAEMRFGNSASTLIAAMSTPAVLQASVKHAMTKGGFKDRELLMIMGGLLPQPKGWQARALNHAAIRAEAKANIEEPLPTSKQTIANPTELKKDKK